MRCQKERRFYRLQDSMKQMKLENGIATGEALARLECLKFE